MGYSSLFGEWEITSLKNAAKNKFVNWSITINERAPHLPDIQRLVCDELVADWQSAYIGDSSHGIPDI